MSLESASYARQNTQESAPRLTTLYALLSGFAMAYSGFTPDPSHAQEPKNTVNTVSQSARGRHTCLDALKQVIDTHKHQLDDAEHAVREQAQAHIEKAIRNALDYRNPLPPEVKQWMSVPRESGGGIEVFKRMQVAAEVLTELEHELPGRIASPDAQTSMKTLLERQLHCNITATTPELGQKLQEYRTGTDGECSDGAFLRLCTDLDAMPIPSADGFILQPRKPGEDLKIQDSIASILLHNGNAFHREVFIMPDKGAILTMLEELKDKNGDPLIFLENLQHFDTTPTFRSQGGFLPWTMSEGQQTPPSKNDAPFSTRKFRTLVGIQPAIAILTPDTKRISLGWQSFFMNQTPQKELYGTWNTCLEGTIWEGMEWPDTTDQEDTYGYQLVAASKIVGIDANGQDMKTEVSGLNVCKRDFSLTVRTPSLPASFRIRAFTHMKEHLLTLP
ncbi:hypothetical protein K8942_02105 [Candidatus Peribacteria bacterium]|nr:MAG: hypothetical protein K8942_02105 [Candidatus Peribacteria bacterium]